MSIIVQLVVSLVLFVILYQYYSYATTSKGVERQKRCQAAGIVYLTLGICVMVFKTVVSVFGGLVLIMFGLRLIAHGLDRIDKKIFIDHYDDDDTPKP